MGMSTVASHVIMFIAVLSISTIVVAVFHDQMDTTTSSVVTQQKWLTNQLKTDITIEVVDFRNGTEDNITAYLENTGATILDPAYIDVYIGGQRIPRDTQNRTINVITDTEVANSGDWDPKEQLEIVVNKTLEENETFTIVVASQYGGRDDDEFST